MTLVDFEHITPHFNTHQAAATGDRTMMGGFMAQAIPAQIRHELEQQLRARYAQLRDEVRQELIDHNGKDYSDIAGKVHDPGDESVADLISDLELAAIDRNINEIRAIETALSHLAAGTYGVCEDCGGEIALERLKAYPTASRCIRCQEIHETAHGGAPPKL